MKIAFSTSGSDLSAPLDSRFGRAPKFLVYDLDNASFEVIDNQQNLNAAQGAGIQSAEDVARSGAKALVSGHCGPNAFPCSCRRRGQGLQQRRPDSCRGPGEVQGGRAEGSQRCQCPGALVRKRQP